MMSGEIIEELIRAVRRELNHDAGDDEPQDLYEIERLRKIFTKILSPRSPR